MSQTANRLHCQEQDQRLSQSAAVQRDSGQSPASNKSRSAMCRLHLPMISAKGSSFDNTACDIYVSPIGMLYRQAVILYRQAEAVAKLGGLQDRRSSTLQELS